MHGYPSEIDIYLVARTRTDSNELGFLWNDYLLDYY